MSGGGTFADRKKQREIDEARRNGELPPEQDEDGRLINPHVPEFMAKAPWYLAQSKGPSLKHQKSSRVAHEAGYAEKRDQYKNYDPRAYLLEIEKWERRDEERKRVRAQEREKQRLAKLEAKEARRTARRSKRAAAGGAAAAAADDDDGDDDSDDSDDSDADSDDDSSDSDSSDDDVREGDAHDAVDEGVMRFGTKMKMTVRNLRVREDRAKYLMNLDPESAFYEPKTRSMRANPNPGVSPGDAVYAGDNATRQTGEFHKFNEAQTFAWEENRRGGDVSLQANPTQVEAMMRQTQERRRKLEEAKQRALRSKYGGDASAAAPGASRPEEQAASSAQKQLLMGTTDVYREYTEDGRLKQVGLAETEGAGAAAATTRRNKRGVILSKYDEDILEGNHKAVWGSFYDTLKHRWGYACCCVTSRAGYCTGIAGRLAYQASRKRATATQAADGEKPKSLAEQVQAASQHERQQAAAAVAQRMEAAGRGGAAGEAGDGISGVRAAVSATGTSGFSATGERDAPTTLRSAQPTLDPAKVAEAVQRRRLEEESRQLKAAAGAGQFESDSGSDGGGEARGRRRRKKRPLADGEEQLTAEEMEAYRITREQAADPMAKLEVDDATAAADARLAAQLEAVRQAKAAGSKRGDGDQRRRRHRDRGDGSDSDDGDRRRRRRRHRDRGDGSDSDDGDRRRRRRRHRDRGDGSDSDDGDRRRRRRRHRDRGDGSDSDDGDRRRRRRRHRDRDD